MQGATLVKVQERLEIRMSAEDKRQARENAKADGYPDRHFALWARSKLTGRPSGPLVGGEDAPYITVSEAAQLLGCSRQTVYACIRRGQIINVVKKPRTAIPRENFVFLAAADERVQQLARDGMLDVWAIKDESDVLTGLVLLGDVQSATRQ